ncbi:MAG: hypothetical protein Q9181_001562 [Wetmoreana brouardii]
MRPASFNGFLIRLQGFSPTSSQNAISSKGLQRTPTSSPQWICLRCHSRLTRTTPPSPSPKPLRGHSFLRTQPRQSVTRPAFLLPSRGHASSTDPKDLSSSSSTNSPNSIPPPSNTPPGPSSLPSHTESLRSPLSQRFTHLMDTIQSSLFTLPQHLNHLTGYTPIESLKTSIAHQEKTLETCRANLAAARTAYSSAIKTRSSSQREVNELLQRKHIWTPADLERFTALYRSDHSNEIKENEAHAALVRAEKEAEEAGARLSEGILKRYHEEQIWSDKIRRMSTWGTWGLMGVNVLLFLVFQFGSEPWRRRRLVSGFEEKVREALERERGRGFGVEETVERGGLVAVKDPMQVELPTETERLVEESARRRKEGGLEAVVDKGLEMAVEEEVESEVAAAVSVQAKRQIQQQEMEQSHVSTSQGQGSIFDYKHLKDTFKDLFSDRQVSVRRWDLTALALEGAAAGMAVVGLIAVLLLRPR